VLLLAVVAHYLSTKSFAVWNLALQMLIYVNLFGMGLQTATARAVALLADAGADAARTLPTIMHAARSISQWATGVGLLMVAALVVGYPYLFPAVPAELLTEFRWTLALFGGAALAQALAQPDMGLYQGLHRNAVFVGVQVAVRLLTVLLVWLGVQTQLSMVLLAALMATAAAMLWPAMRVAVAKGIPWAKDIGASPMVRKQRRELLQYCGTLSVWSVCMLLVNSAGIVIVGRIDFGNAGPYAIATTATTVLVGLLSAALSPLLTTAAALYGNYATRHRLPTLLARITLWVNIGLNLLVIFVITIHSFMLQIWVGDTYAKTAGPLVVVLVAAHCLRNVGAPYALMLLATGLNKRALWSAVFEGVANAVATIVMGLKWGAMGVAMGSLMGSFLGIVGMMALNPRKTPELTPRPLMFVFKSVALPIVLFAPIQYCIIDHMGFISN
jgi:O-antigen/teichoic acid export membrane protein